MTREQDRIKFEKRLELTRAYGLATGLLEGIKSYQDYNKAGVVSVLEEIQEILKKQIGVKYD